MEMMKVKRRPTRRGRWTVMRLTRTLAGKWRIEEEDNFDPVEIDRIDALWRQVHAATEDSS